MKRVIFEEKGILVSREIANGNVNYQIQNDTISEIQGNVVFCFRKIKSFKQEGYYKTNNVIDHCLKNGLLNNDLLTHLKIFYPNGGYAKIEQMRNGIGSIILQLIENEAEEESAKGIYVLSTTESMENFMKKKDFEQCKKFKNQFYKFL